MVLSDHLRDRLRRQYCDPPRHYHTFEHASTVAERVADLGGNRACVLAAWFHDAVYQPTASDNEARSAVLLTDWLAHDPDVDEAARLVRLTDNHDPASGDRQGAILCDADLATLGGSPTDYAAYRQDVRKEYAHVPDQQWRTGRAAVLRGFLARDRIYHSPLAYDRWEAAARRNLTAERADLSQ
ncbi:hypothetical protein BH24ACT15_BH24ACT15_12040 [soil metagenome]